MKTNHLFLLLVFLLVSFSGVKAQRVTFTYDAAGNRISGKTISMLRSDPEEEEEDELSTGYSEVISERIIKIYPNPTKGLIRIDFENMQNEDKAIIRLYDLSGRRIATRENVSESSEIDITLQPDGIYILKIIIGESETEWKVIKN